MPLDLKSFAVGKANGGGGEPGEIVTEKLSVKANGTYIAPSGKAYTPVVVNVKPTYSVQDETLFISGMVKSEVLYI